MHKRTRNVLFYGAIVIFLLASPIVVAYALGFKYDFTKYQFVKTGSFRVKINTDASVLVDGKSAGSTLFLANSFSESRLLPKIYTVRLDKSGYQSWHKQVDVLAGFFTDFPKVVMVPSSFQSTIVASSSFGNVTSVSFDRTTMQATFYSSAPVPVKGSKKPSLKLAEAFDLSTGEKVTPTPSPTPSAKPTVSVTTQPTPTPNPLVLYNDPITHHQIVGLKSAVSPANDRVAWFSAHELWLTWTQDTAYQPFITKDTTSLIAQFPDTIADVQWYKDNEHLIVGYTNGTIRLVEIDTRGGANIYDLPDISGPFLYDADSGKIYTFQGKNLLSTQLP